MSFPDAKPFLLGGDSHAAAVTLAQALDQGLTQANGSNSSSMQTTRNTIGSDGNAVITWSNITTPTETSVLIIIIVSSTFIAGSTLSKDWFLKRDTTTIDTFSLESSDTNSQNTDMRVYTNFSPTAGTNTYTLEEDGGNTFGGIAGTLFFITGDGVLTGANTNSTHETEVLP